jgi:hypothetical protein
MGNLFCLWTRKTKKRILNWDGAFEFDSLQGKAHRLTEDLLENLSKCEGKPLHFALAAKGE